MAYQSDESGQFEIYVQRFPEGTNRLMVSHDGGAQPRWNPNGRELFYVASDARLMSVPINPGPNGHIEARVPTSLFVTHIGGAVLPAFIQQYVVAQNGERFLMNTTLEETNTTPLTVLLNWHS